jgi:acetyl/propionyl-CoA carboxylase alpha subunit
MIAKLIAHAPNRDAAAAQLANACRHAEIWPVKTNAAFLGNAVSHPDFLAAQVDTGFIEARIDELLGETAPSPTVLQAAAAAMLKPQKLGAALAGFRLNAPPCIEIRLQHAGETHAVRLTPPLGASILPTATYGDETIVFESGRAFAFADAASDAGVHGPAASDGVILSPMPGHIISVLFAKGDVVTKGAALVVMEAMKMEMTLAAPFAGVIAELNAKAGERVAEGVVLLRLEVESQ